MPNVPANARACFSAILISQHDHTSQYVYTLCTESYIQDWMQADTAV